MKSKLTVMKFGGTSLENKERVFSVAEKIKNEKNKVVVIVSAQGDTTDDLLNLANEINSSPNLRELDVLVSAGEQISMALLCMALEKLGVNSISLTGWQAGIQTCNCYGNAKIINIFTNRILKELESHDVIVIAGFQGINKNEDITTMGRGGSDTSAIAISAALNAKECKIYTDVNGVFTADPRIVSNAELIDKISYDDMINLADNGAKVLNKRSVRLAKKYGIEISVLSSMSNDEIGTSVKEVDFSANQISSVAITENLFILKIDPSNFDYISKIIQVNKIPVFDVVFSEIECVFFIDMGQIDILSKNVKECEAKIDPNVSKITIISNNQDNIFNNFCDIKLLLGEKIKYSHVCECISIVVDESIGRESLDLIHEKYLMKK